MLADTTDFRRIATRVLLFSALISLFFHLAVVVLTGKLTKFAPRDFSDKQALEVSLVSPEMLETVKTFQQTAEEAPDQARFASDRNLRTDEETSPDQARTDIVQAPPSQGQAQQQQAQQQSQERSEPRKIDSFSLSEVEKQALNNPLLERSAQDRAQRFSRGFIEKLKRGDELKLNALGLDYGQYILRMKERMQQRWRPQSTITPQMYDYDKVVVTLAVVLDERGELVDLRVFNKSLFPNYDDEAIRTFKESAPFPNPPDSLIQEDGRLYLTWAFSLMLGNAFTNSSIY